MPWAPKIHKPSGVQRVARVRVVDTEAKRIRNSVQWQRFRAYARRLMPLCVLCVGEGRAEPTAHIHHIEPLSERPDLALRIDNAAGVCTRCHGKLNAMERAGASTSEMFVIVADCPPQGRVKSLRA